MTTTGEPGDELMSIGQLATQTGVSSRTIRYYEELGIVPAPKRSAGGTRKYTSEYRFYIEGALALKELGFSLEEIKLVGRLALGRKLSARQRWQAEKAIHEKMQLLEHKVEVLNRLRSVLHAKDRSNAAAQASDASQLVRMLQTGHEKTA